MKVPISTLILDYDLYPRASVDSQHVSHLIEALEAGTALPAIVVCKKTKKVVDGFHRIKAYLRVYGDNAEIDVRFKVYKGEKDLFVDAVRFNAAHGQALHRCDRVRCGQIAKRMRIGVDQIAEVLNIAIDQYRQLLKERSAKSASTKEEVALKNTIKHMAGQKLTKKQEEVNKKASGMNVSFHVNQIVMLMDAELIDLEDEKLIGNLESLRDALAVFLAEVRS